MLFSRLDPSSRLVCYRYADPFEDYKQRLARRLQAKAGHDGAAGTSLTKDVKLDALPGSKGNKLAQRDDVNWFGVKLGQKGSPGSPAATNVVGGATGAGAGVGVGKYLNLAASAPKASAPTKRSANSLAVGAAADDGGKKKRKLGFGNFDAW